MENLPQETINKIMLYNIHPVAEMLKKEIPKYYWVNDSDNWFDGYDNIEIRGINVLNYIVFKKSYNKLRETNSENELSDDESDDDKLSEPFLRCDFIL